MGKSRKLGPKDQQPKRQDPSKRKDQTAAEEQKGTAAASESTAQTGKSNKETPKKKTIAERVERSNPVLSFISSIVAIVGIPFAVIQIMQANASYQQAIEQFNAEGATYRINIIDGPTMSISAQESTGYLSYVITNTGRTRGTILDIDRDLDDENLTICVPHMTGNGDLELPSKDRTWEDVMPVNHQFTLEPGQSQLVFMTLPVNEPQPIIDENGQPMLVSGVPLTVTTDLRLHKSDGTSELISMDTADPVATKHYKSLKRYDQALDYCAQSAERSN